MGFNGYCRLMYNAVLFFFVYLDFCSSIRQKVYIFDTEKDRRINVVDRDIQKI
jgi:hypothetical protein